MKIPIRIKPCGPGPATTLLIRRTGKMSRTTDHRKLHPSHPNTHLQWPAQRERVEQCIIQQATSRTVTRITLGVLLLLLTLNDAARATESVPRPESRVRTQACGLRRVDRGLWTVDASNKTWLLSANLHVADGCTLSRQGDAVGGDVRELRHLSADRDGSLTQFKIQKQK